MSKNSFVSLFIQLPKGKQNEFGIDPMYAIRAATYWPSLWMGVSEKVGTITPGKKADIIAVKGDVLRNISILQRIDIVLKDGKIVEKPN